MSARFAPLALFPLLALVACGDPTKDDPATACNEENEACGPDELCDGEGGEMLPGSDCLACHSAGNLPDDKAAAPKASSDGEDEEELFTAAGTVFADLDGTAPLSGAIVRITDADGAVVELTTNDVGNFYTSTPLTAPLSAEIEVDGEIVEMDTTPDEGACNSCHSCEGAAGGKLTGP